MKAIVLSDDADADIMRAAIWYENQRENLGAKFLDRVDEALGLIQRNPEGPQEILPNLRHVQLKKFKPYGLWYVTAKEILVIGCIHGKRQVTPLVRGRLKALET